MTQELTSIEIEALRRSPTIQTALAAERQAVLRRRAELAGAIEQADAQLARDLPPIRDSIESAEVVVKKAKAALAAAVAKLSECRRNAAIINSRHQSVVSRASRELLGTADHAAIAAADDVLKAVSNHYARATSGWAVAGEKLAEVLQARRALDDLLLDGKRDARAAVVDVLESIPEAAEAAPEAYARFLAIIGDAG